MFSPWPPSGELRRRVGDSAEGSPVTRRRTRRTRTGAPHGHRHQHHLDHRQALASRSGRTPSLDPISDALLLQVGTLVGKIEGDEPAIRVPYVADDGTATFVSEGEEIPGGPGRMNEVASPPTRSPPWPRSPAGSSARERRRVRPARDAAFGRRGRRPGVPGQRLQPDRAAEHRRHLHSPLTHIITMCQGERGPHPSCREGAQGST